MKLYLSLDKYIILLLIILNINILNAHAQNGDNMPYSRFGMGDPYNASNFQSAGMGGLNVALSHVTFVNFNNPASYTKLIRTAIEGGMTANISALRADTSSFTSANATISYIIMGSRFGTKGKLGASVGLLPFTRVNYNVIQLFSDSLNGNGQYRYQGQGNLYKFYTGAAYRLGRFSLGLNAAYIFGNTEYARYTEFLDTTTIYQTKSSILLNPRGFEYTFGSQYTHEFKSKIDSNKNNTLTLGITYTPNIIMNGNKDEVWERFTYNNDGSISPLNRDTIYSSLNEKGNIILPMNWSIGALWQSSTKSSYGINIQHTGWSSFRNYGKTENMTNETRINIGTEWTPSRNHTKKLNDQITYRCGIYHSTGHLFLYNTKIKDTGVNLGLTLKRFIFGNYNYIHFATQLGYRGSQKNNLIQETYFQFKLGFTFGELWGKPIKIN